MGGAGHVVMSGVVADAILAHARADAPFEACGLLLGHALHVRRAVPTANLARSTTRYEVSPEEHFAAIRLARADDMFVIGAYHSHPNTGAEPSPTDRDAAFADFIFLIAAPLATPSLRAWRLVGGNFAECLLVRT